ncbi:MAG: 50S ribosomal protein L25 [Candidatus Omnitrophica bacterium]|nr:50S ribosomal protein L25 [Candidatus Omnitrophota bacterium]
MPKDIPKIILEGSIRSPGSKGPARALRQEGWIPGVVYGQGKNPLVIRVSSREVSRLLRVKGGANSLITLRLQDSDKPLPESAVLIKELQRHPVSHEIVHVDFHRVSLTQRITVKVALAFKGEPVGVKNEGGILEHLRWDLEVECLPTQIPSEIPVDVSSLALGATLHAKQVLLPEGVRLTTDGELPVAACVTPKVEEIAAPSEEAAAAGEEPEVLKQKKPEEIAALEEAKAQEKDKREGAKGKEEKKG